MAILFLRLLGLRTLFRNWLSHSYWSSYCEEFVERGEHIEAVLTSTPDLEQSRIRLRAVRVVERRARAAGLEEIVSDSAIVMTMLFLFGAFAVAFLSVVPPSEWKSFDRDLVALGSFAVLVSFAGIVATIFLPMVVGAVRSRRSDILLLALVSGLWVAVGALAVDFTLDLPDAVQGGALGAAVFGIGLLATLFVVRQASSLAVWIVLRRPPAARLQLALMSACGAAHEQEVTAAGSDSRVVNRLEAAAVAADRDLRRVIPQPGDSITDAWLSRKISGVSAGIRALKREVIWSKEGVASLATTLRACALGVLDERWEVLPQAEPPAVERFIGFRRLRRIGLRVAIAVMPLGIVIGAQIVDPKLGSGDQLEASLTSLSVLWLLGNLISLTGADGGSLLGSLTSVPGLPGWPDSEEPADERDVRSE